MKFPESHHDPPANASPPIPFQSLSLLLYGAGAAAVRPVTPAFLPTPCTVL